MWWLGSQLARDGFPVHYFNYSTTRSAFDQEAERLAKFIDEIGPEVNMVGHSLGGLLAVAAASRVKASGKIVALGSPFNGSVAAKWLADSPLGAPMLGNSRELLGRKFDVLLNDRWKLGIVAGTSTLGLGLITGTLNGPHDGTVRVEETKLPGAAHVLVPTTHTCMIWSGKVRAQIVNFLREGKFIEPEQV